MISSLIHATCGLEVENSDVSSNLTGSTLSFNTKRMIGGLKSMRVKGLESKAQVVHIPKSLPPSASTTGPRLT